MKAAQLCDQFYVDFNGSTLKLFFLVLGLSLWHWGTVIITCINCVDSPCAWSMCTAFLKLLLEVKCYKLLCSSSYSYSAVYIMYPAHAPTIFVACLLSKAHLYNLMSGF